MAALLYFLRPLFVFGRGTLFLTLELVFVGAIGVAAYGAIVLSLDKPMRDFLRKALRASLW